MGIVVYLVSTLNLFSENNNGKQDAVSHATASRYQGTVAYMLRRAKRMMLVFLAICAAVWLLTKRPLVLFFILHTKKPPWFSPGRLPSVR